jgi:hypothetical protein
MTKQRNIRKVMLLLIMLFIMLGPFYRQVLGGTSYLFRPWIMFADRGVGIFVVDFRERKANGSEVRIDYMQALGYGNTPHRQRPKSLWRITSWEDGVLRIGDQLCRALGEARDIRVYSQRADKDGWKVHHAATRNLCAGSSTAK